MFQSVAKHGAALSIYVMWRFVAYHRARNGVFGIKFPKFNFLILWVEKTECVLSKK